MLEELWRQLQTKKITVDNGCQRQIILQKDKLSLYRYQPLNHQKLSTPVLIVYALINRSTLLDLTPRISFIKQLLGQGHEVYLIDWGYPTYTDQHIKIDDYIQNYLYTCVEKICVLHQISKINLLGICQGGVFSLCFSSLYPEKINKLITMVTPVDFHTADNQITNLLKHIDIRAMVNKFGNIPGDFFIKFFTMLKPYRLTLGKYLDVQKRMGDENSMQEFLKVEQWKLDNPDHVGAAFLQFGEEFYQQNKLIKGEIKIGHAKVNLANIKIPVFNIIAIHDHIVPPSSSLALSYYVNSVDYQEYLCDYGHIGIFVSARALQEIPEKIDQFLKA